MSESSKIGTKTNPTDLAASSSSSSPEIRTIEEPSTVTDSNRDTNPSVRPDYIVPLGWGEILIIKEDSGRRN